ncbi:hypothetical protein CHELA1G11_70003 [Hyphomicrobiales bacterium]|jgi:hypothetical protein|nr:hypothetical protein CHELA1G2_60046 [Hyphomicrobiales bacterium]CAH1696897.1 hypothetical protein CHELA1G11_70003 [Hyphomicrobiales bacterium]
MKNASGLLGIVGSAAVLGRIGAWIIGVLSPSMGILAAVSLISLAGSALGILIVDFLKDG